MSRKLSMQGCQVSMSPAGQGSARASRGRGSRDLLQDGAEASLSLVSTDSDGSTLWIVLGNG